MKLIIAIIRPERLEAVQQQLQGVLDEEDHYRLTVETVEGHGRQEGEVEIYRGQRLRANLVEKLKLTLGVNEAYVEKAIGAILAAPGPGRSATGRSSSRRWTTASVSGLASEAPARSEGSCGGPARSRRSSSLPLEAQLAANRRTAIGGGDLEKVLTRRKRRDGKLDPVVRLASGSEPLSAHVLRVVPHAAALAVQDPCGDPHRQRVLAAALVDPKKRRHLLAGVRTLSEPSGRTGAGAQGRPSGPTRRAA